MGSHGSEFQSPPRFKDSWPWLCSFQGSHASWVRCVFGIGGISSLWVHRLSGTRTLLLHLFTWPPPKKHNFRIILWLFTQLRNTLVNLKRSANHPDVFVCTMPNIQMCIQFICYFQAKQTYIIKHITISQNQGSCGYNPVPHLLRLIILQPMTFLQSHWLLMLAFFSLLLLLLFFFSHNTVLRSVSIY